MAASITNAAWPALRPQARSGSGAPLATVEQMPRDSDAAHGTHGGSVCAGGTGAAGAFRAAEDGEEWMHRDRRVERMSRCTCVPPAAARPMMAALKDGWAPRNGTDAVIGRHARQAAPRRHAANICPSGCTAPALELDPLALVRASRVPHARRARVRLPALLLLRPARSRSTSTGGLPRAPEPGTPRCACVPSCSCSVAISSCIRRGPSPPAFASRRRVHRGRVS